MTTDHDMKGTDRGPDAPEDDQRPWISDPYPLAAFRLGYFVAAFQYGDMAADDLAKLREAGAAISSGAPAAWRSEFETVLGQIEATPDSPETAAEFAKLAKAARRLAPRQSHAWFDLAHLLGECLQEPPDYGWPGSVRVGLTVGDLQACIRTLPPRFVEQSPLNEIFQLSASGYIVVKLGASADDSAGGSYWDVLHHAAGSARVNSIFLLIERQLEDLAAGRDLLANPASQEEQPEDESKPTPDDQSEERITLRQMGVLMGMTGKALGNLLTEQGIKPAPVVVHAGTRPAQFNYADLRVAITKAHADGIVKLPEKYMDAMTRLREEDARIRSSQ